mgnify:CR=1 FL=1|tara:strand:+ start:978 stop:1781 length:804 start_codon:yes stop_codon:yes gene_type:complete
MVFFKKSGSSLIEVMFALVLMSITTLAIFQLANNHNRSIKALGEKLLSKEIKNSLMYRFTNMDFCGCIFRGKTFDTTNNTFSSRINSIPNSFTNIPTFPALCTPSSQVLIPPLNQNFGNEFQVKVGNIVLDNIAEVAPGSGNYTGSVRVDFTNSLAAIRPVSVDFAFNVDLSQNSSTDRPFAGCGSKNTIPNMEIREYYIRANRNECRDVWSNSAQAHRFCALKYIRGGGDSHSWACNVENRGSGVWRLEACAADDPWAECTMICHL